VTINNQSTVALCHADVLDYAVKHSIEFVLVTDASFRFTNPQTITDLILQVRVHSMSISHLLFNICHAV
jgi:hypothetical protein